MVLCGLLEETRPVLLREKPATTPLKLLSINPVTPSAYNEAFANMIKSVKLPNAEVHIASLILPGINLTNLEWRAFETKIADPVVHLARYAGANGYDGYCIPCFSDTALDEAREMSGKAIVSARYPARPRSRRLPASATASR